MPPYHTDASHPPRITPTHLSQSDLPLYLQSCLTVCLSDWRASSGGGVPTFPSSLSSLPSDGGLPHHLWRADCPPPPPRRDLDSLCAGSSYSSSRFSRPFIERRTSSSCSPPLPGRHLKDAKKSDRTKDSQHNQEVKALRSALITTGDSTLTKVALGSPTALSLLPALF